MAEQNYYLKNTTITTNLTIPNAIFTNGIAVFQEDSSRCKDYNIGKMMNFFFDNKFDNIQLYHQYYTADMW